MKIRVLYFAGLRQQSGCSEEVVETRAPSADLLYQEIKDKKGLGFSIDHLRVARNGGFCPSNATLEEGDVIAFMPPMAGG